MRLKVLALALFAMLAAPAFSQLRLDVGVDLPRNVGAVLGSQVQTSGTVGSALSATFFPFPEAALYYQFGGSLLHFGVGLRAFTFIIESIAWPNAYAEVVLGPVAIEAQVGGGLFAAFGLANSLTTGALVFPDLSAWLRLGKSFRLGGGAIAVYLPDSLGGSAGLPFLLYFGGKASILF